MNRNQFTVRLADGTRLRLPLAASGSVALAGAVPRSRRRLTLQCAAGLHFVGVVTDTDPAFVVRAGDRFPSFAVVDGGFAGVTTDDAGEGVLFGGPFARVRIGCRQCDFAEGWLDYEAARSAPTRRGASVVLDSA